MKKSYWLAVLIVTVMVLSSVLLVGCGKKEVSSAGGVISDVAMSASVDAHDRPLGPTDVFVADTRAIYCSFKVSDLPPGAVMSVKLLYVGDEAQGTVGGYYVPGEYVGTMERKGQTSVFWLRSSMNNDVWPKGDYKAVLSVQGEEKASASFKVQ